MLARRKRLTGGAAIRIIGLGFALVVSAGCAERSSDGYDFGVRFAMRNDPIVLSSPKDTPTSAPDPLRLDEYLAGSRTRGGEVVDQTEIPIDIRNELRDVLLEQFGTPAAPKLPDGHLELGGINIDSATLAAGSSSYRIRCASCHGTEGDGRGVGAGFPYPRDFRSGRYKRTTGHHAEKPRIDDLRRVIRGGIPGTSMPLFDLISDDAVDALATTVIHLSIRGEVEAMLIRGIHPESENPITDIPTGVRSAFGKVVASWRSAQMAKPFSSAVDSSDESIRRGHQLFLSNGCLGCHTNYGRTPTYRYDIWALPNKVPDLTQPENKWGREPADWDRLLQKGIPPAQMPATQLNESDRRALAAFLMALPYSAKLPDDVRRAVQEGHKP